MLICVRFSTDQSEASSASITQEAGCSTDAVTSLRTQLSSIQDSISKTQDMINFQATKVDSVLESISVASWNQSPTIHNNTVSRRPPNPMTALEASRSFFAESYTVDSQITISCLVIIDSFRQTNQVDSKTNIYKIFFLNSFRRWQWFTISLQIPSSSIHWAATTDQGKGRQWQTPTFAHTTGLPNSLIKKLQVFLCQGVKFNDNARMRLSLCNRDNVEQQPQIPQINTLLPPSRSLSTASNALNYLHDLGCQRYDESEVVQIKIADPSNCFCSCVNGILVYEIKSKDATPAVGMLYTIRVLHCMSGTQGFAKLLGIITDSNQRFLKGYLIQLPGVRWNLYRMAVNPSVSWERREKWAAQLVRGVDQVHVHGFVVGGLHIWDIPVIDNSDAVQF